MDDLLCMQIFVFIDILTHPPYCRYRTRSASYFIFTRRMATANAKEKCFTCNEEPSTFLCAGCSKNFCPNDLMKHLQILSQDLDQLENDHDLFREKINQHIDGSNTHLLIQTIDRWEKNSITKIQQTAIECRERVMNYTKKVVIEIEEKVNHTARELKRIREENKFNEIDLDRIRQKLNKLKEEFDQPTDISIEEESSPFINRIIVTTNSHNEMRWKQNGITVGGGYGWGKELNQLICPSSIFINNNNRTFYIADFGNHRIVEWKSDATQGQIVAGGNGQGNQINQLNHPITVVIDKETDSLMIAEYGNKRVMRWSLQNKTNGEIIIENVDNPHLTMNKNGDLYVSESKKNEVRRWRRGERGHGTVVAGGNEQGDRFNQFHSPSYLFVDEDDSLYVSDVKNHRVMKWIKGAKEGIVVAGGNGEGNSLRQLSSPQGVIVDQLGQVYVVDYGNHRVMCWRKGAIEGRVVVGGNGQGQQSNQLSGPFGLSFDQEGNLYVADRFNHRIQKFEID